MSDAWGQVNYRGSSIEQLNTESVWDMVIVGGGITGAGILHAAAGAGLKVLLIEQRDFAWGSSSRSSKMVHGGLRYLARGQWRLARESVREREKLLTELPGLVQPLPFLMGHYKNQFPYAWLFNMLLTGYDFLAGKRNHRLWSGNQLAFVSTGMRQGALRAASQFADAVTDDARLVLRLLKEGVAAGGQALNYVRAEQVVKQQGRVSGLSLSDVETGHKVHIKSHCVVNATGAWSDELSAQLGAAARIRPLRGSHLVVPAWRLPVAFAISFLHPSDKRPVFVFPWEGVTVIGTTDVDHQTPLAQEACISQSELDYLLLAVNSQFPTAAIGVEHLICTWAGVRPVVSHGEGDKPSDENREHALWDDSGMISVAGGKLTTFRVIAEDVLRAARRYLPSITQPKHLPLFRPCIGTRPARLNTRQWQRLQGRLGPQAQALLGSDLTPIAHTETLWAELEWALKQEMVVHLDDLLLRRTRLGLLLGSGIDALWPRIEKACEAFLGWNSERWQRELAAYQSLMNKCYGLPSKPNLEV